MTLKVPKFEQFQEGQQIRISSKSVRSTIVERYGKRVYKSEFIKFIVYALASNDETTDHLETLLETKSLSDEQLFNTLHSKSLLLGRKISNFLKSLHENHSKPYQGGSGREPDTEYQIIFSAKQKSSDQYPESLS
jgi:four helix bundle protein